ncbi:MAG TPA: MazG nucleotide pyrophosphohydrolase domain-containing protein [Pyrinomonadaceae bacterium]|nr:MazG nucleotide pyrophosphohydrolase domain-containing protein [Pyrinomonadaceae bacterium]
MTHTLSATVPSDIIATNVNVFSGDLLLTDTYSPEINPEVFERLSRGRRAVSFCPELTHLDILGFKLCTIFRLKRVTSLVVLTKDGSPHSMQIPLMVQEAAEDTDFDKANIEYYCLEGGLVHTISDLTVRKARHYSEIEKLLPYAKLEAVTAVLRSENGCPNDRAETYESVIEHLREEVEELAEALRKNDMENFYEESGDILYNLALLGQISRENEARSLKEIAGQAAQKMIDRHESVFETWKAKY